MRRTRVRPVPRPFLKWAGGKRQLLPELLKRVDAAGRCGGYHEPFLGGGALFFELCRTGRLPGGKACLSDSNDRLMETYRGVRSDPDRLVQLLSDHAEKHSKEHYYAVRSCVPSDPVERAARIIYLNRTCFNGLFRENSKGGFNVPMGRYKNPTICEEENLRAVSQAIGGVDLETRSFETVLEQVEPGDLVYLDPPYHPVSATASFTAYEKNGFGEDAQRQLAHVYRELTHRGAKALLSNSYTPLVCELYKGFEMEQVHARRSVNSRADRRGEVPEALVRNF